MTIDWMILKLRPVLRWPISSRSAVQEGLYSYDAIRWRQDVNLDVQATSDGQAASDNDLRAGVLADRWQLRSGRWGPILTLWQA